MKYLSVVCVQSVEVVDCCRWCGCHDDRWHHRSAGRGCQSGGVPFRRGFPFRRIFEGADRCHGGFENARVVTIRRIVSADSPYDTPLTRLFYLASVLGFGIKTFYS